MRKIVFLLFVFLANFVQAQSDTYKVYTLPVVTKIVNDFEQILSDEEENQLTAMLQEYEQKTTNQIVVVTVSSIDPFENIFDFSLKLAQRVKSGIAGKDNGILIVVSKKRREIQIQNGDGIVAKLTDEETKAIIYEAIIPEFKKGDYFSGLKIGIEKIASELD